MYEELDEIIKRIAKVEHGFKPIESEALQILKSHSPEDVKVMAIRLLENELYQVRSLAVFLLGYIASEDPSVLDILKDEVSNDQSWQVQEILAKAFDQFCKDTGYEEVLPIIEEWLADKNPNVCRAVTEGLRIWTGRPFFKSNPELAIKLISQHKASDSEYLRKSVGNSLRDISKKYRDLVDKEVLAWNLSDKKVFFTYKLVVKNRG